MTTSRKTVETTLNYYDQIHGPKVLNLNAAEAQSYKWIPVPAEITDMRSCDEEFTLDKNGFQLVEFQAGTSGFEDQKSIREQVYPKVVEMLKQVYVTNNVFHSKHFLLTITMIVRGHLKRRRTSTSSASPHSQTSKHEHSEQTVPWTCCLPAQQPIFTSVSLIHTTSTSRNHL